MVCLSNTYSMPYFSCCKCKIRVTTKIPFTEWGREDCAGDTVFLKRAWEPAAGPGSTEQLGGHIWAGTSGRRPPPAGRPRAEALSCAAAGPAAVPQLGACGTARPEERGHNRSWNRILGNETGTAQAADRASNWLFVFREILLEFVRWKTRERAI